MLRYVLLYLNDAKIAATVCFVKMLALLPFQCIINKMKLIKEP